MIGGGHGQAAVCRGIKNIEGIELSAIVTVADNGGSTGRLRKMFNTPAMGDIRDVMIALSQDESLMRELMDYRFQDPQGTLDDVAGHNLGNLILLALMQKKGSFLEAVKEIGKVLNVKGKIIPSTTQVVTLCALMEDGCVVEGQAEIPMHPGGIRKVFYNTHVSALPEAVEAIKEADWVIYCIGSLYTSVIPNVIINEIQEALQKTRAKRVYICNAMSQPGETDGYSLEDHVRALEDAGCGIDICIASMDEIPAHILARYRAEGSDVVRATESVHKYQIIEEELLKFDDELVRHDSNKIEIAIGRLLEGM